MDMFQKDEESRRYAVGWLIGLVILVGVIAALYK
jgi:hypothetical protein